MKKLFDTKDFDVKAILLPQEAADIANDVMEKLLKESQVVYKPTGSVQFGWTQMMPTGGYYLKGHVLLIEQEEFKECTQHTPSFSSKQPQGVPATDMYGGGYLLGSKIVCAVCGVELKPSWDKK